MLIAILTTDIVEDEVEQVISNKSVLLIGGGAGAYISSFLAP